MTDWKLKYKQVRREQTALSRAIGGLLSELRESSFAIAEEVHGIHRAIYGLSNRKHPVKVKSSKSLVLRWRKLQNTDRFDGLQALVQNDMVLQPGEVDNWLGQVTDAINGFNQEFAELVDDTLEHTLGKKKKQS